MCSSDLGILIFLFWAQIFCQLTRQRHWPISVQWPSSEYTLLWGPFHFKASACAFRIHDLIRALVLQINIIHSSVLNPWEPLLRAKMVIYGGHKRINKKKKLFIRFWITRTIYMHSLWSDLINSWFNRELHCQIKIELFLVQAWSDVVSMYWWRPLPAFLRLGATPVLASNFHSTMLNTWIKYWDACPSSDGGRSSDMIGVDLQKFCAL